MRLTITLRRASDGAERNYADEADDLDGLPYQWGEGNFGCDCNRALFWARAADEDEPDEPPCSEGAYLARIIGPDGGELYRDEAWT